MKKPKRRFITEIVPHESPHLDEIVALMLLRMFPEGEELYPGVKTAKFGWFGAGAAVGNLTAQDFPYKLFLGAFESNLDEHGPEIAQECCATLTARELGLRKLPGLEKLLADVLYEDRNGAQSPNCIAPVVKNLHLQFPGQPMIAIEWATQVSHAEYRFQTQAWENCQRAAVEKDRTAESLWEETKKSWKPLTLKTGHELLKSMGDPKADQWLATGKAAVAYMEEQFQLAKVEFESAWRRNDPNILTHTVEFRNPRKDTLRIVAFVSSNKQMSRFLRSKHAGFNVVVIKNPDTEHVQVFTDRKLGLDVTDVASVIRVWEARVRGVRIPLNPEYLGQIGNAFKLEMWHLHEKRNMLLNGSHTAIFAEPTVLSFGDIFEAVLIGLDTEAYERSREQFCHRCRCTSTPQSSCGWYGYHLRRCENIRKYGAPESQGY